MTLAQNGVTLYDHLRPEQLKGAVIRIGEASMDPLMLQEHGTAMQYRNLWIVDQSGRK